MVSSGTRFKARESKATRMFEAARSVSLSATVAAMVGVRSVMEPVGGLLVMVGGRV